MREHEVYLPYLDEEEICRFHAGQSVHAYAVLGCHYMQQLNMHRFVVWAPNAREISVVGEFNHWDAQAAPMHKYAGMFYAFIGGLHNGQLYKYRVVGYDGQVVYKADPFAFYAEAGGEHASRIWDINGYTWQDADYLEARAEQDIQCAPVSMYELHLGSWKWNADGSVPNYRQIAPLLVEYCQDMGYTHIELLPITEYPFEESWGYQVTGYFAPTSRYGTPQDFMYFVDTLHQAGIGVVMDWVPAHFPRDAYGLARFDGTALYEHKNPLQGEHPEWGTLIFNYGRPQVSSFLISSAMLFLDYYHIDGIRVDAVSSMLYLDYGRGGHYIPNKYGGNIDLAAVDFLRRLNSVVLSTYPGCMTIAEESTAYPLVTYPPEVEGLGFTFKWDMGFMHDTLEYLSMDHLFRRYHHDKLTFSMLYAFSERFVLAFSHDEVVHGKKSLLNKMFGSYTEKFAALRALYGYQFAHPGKKLNFMGSEFGQFIEWNHHQPLDWLLLDYPAHRGVLDYMRELNRLYRQHPALYTIEDCWDGFSWLNVDDRDRSSIAFMRKDLQGDALVCVYNFTPVHWQNFVIGLPGAGSLQLLLNSDDERFGGWGLEVECCITAQKRSFIGREYSAQLDLPPLSSLWFTYHPLSLPVENIDDIAERQEEDPENSLQ